MSLTNPASRSGSTVRSRAVRVAALVMAAASLTAGQPQQSSHRFIVGPKVSTGARITPTAAPGAIFERLDPEVAADSTIRANQGVTTATSPDGRTLLVLTSGYNYWDLPPGSSPSFVYDDISFTTCPRGPAKPR